MFTASSHPTVVLTRLLVLLFTLTGPPALVRAGSDDQTPSETICYPALSRPDVFRKGAVDLQIMSGVLFSVQQTSDRRPNIDYDLGVIRLGYMIDNAYGPGLLRGNDELLLEGMGGSIFVGPGSGLGGLSLMYRRNFLRPGLQTRLVPYLGGGVGGIYTDAYHQRIQHALGAPGEFDLQAGAGLKFRLTPRWSLDAEINYRHLSNANFAHRNDGTNAIGGLIGVSRGF